MQSKTFLSYDINNISDAAILRSRPESDVGLGLSKHIVQMKDWPRSDIFGEVEMLGDSKCQTYTSYDHEYEKVLRVLLDLGLERKEDEANETSDEQPDIEVWFYKNHEMILIHVPDLYVLPEAKNITMKRPYESFETVSESDIAILRIRPQDRIDDGLSKYVVQMRGWPYTTIFGTVISSGNFKRTLYDQESPFYFKIKEVLSDLGLEETGTPKGAVIEVRRYLIDHTIAIIVPDAYEYTRPKGKTLKKRKGVEMEDLKKGNYKKLDPETQKLMGETFSSMAAILRTFEVTHPGSATAWEMLGWQDTCINHIRRNLESGSIIDAMNYLMFANHHGWDVSKVLESKPELIVHDPEDRENRTYDYEFKTVKDSQDYSKLYSVLMDALDQAAYGKGKERHATDKSFEDQPMQTISDLAGSPDGMAYQVIKKVQEALRLPDFSRQKRELLGAIVYAAGMIIWLEKQPTE